VQTLCKDFQTFALWAGSPATQSGGNWAGARFKEPESSIVAGGDTAPRAAGHGRATAMVASNPAHCTGSMADSCAPPGRTVAASWQQCNNK